MRYIKEDKNGFVAYDGYFSYLESKRHEMPPEIYKFAANPARHDLTSKESLHDSLIESVYIKSFYGEVPRKAGLEHEDVKIVLLGPWHDRRHILRYFGVASCKIDFEFCGYDTHRDLLCHELRFENGHIEHEFEFVCDMSWEITSLRMTHEEIMI